MTKGITYKNSIFTLPGWVPDAFNEQLLGYAYESGDFFVHFYGRQDNLWTISSGLTASEKIAGVLNDWVIRVFGASCIQVLQHDVGSVIDGVWRPGLYFQDHIFQALHTNQTEQRAAEQSLYLLVDSLNKLFLYVEPEGAGLGSYGPKTRELLILACTEVENSWAYYMRRAGVIAPLHGYTTREYVRLNVPLHLAEFQVTLRPYAQVPKVRPFEGWRTSHPTQSIGWYDAYNKAKHDRSSNLCLATLLRCVEAVAANIVLFCVRFSPIPLYNQTTPLASLVNHLFTVDLVGCDPTTFYVPLVEFTNRRTDLVCGESRDSTKHWTVKPLIV